MGGASRPSRRPPGRPVALPRAALRPLARAPAPVAPAEEEDEATTMRPRRAPPAAASSPLAEPERARRPPFEPDEPEDKPEPPQAPARPAAGSRLPAAPGSHAGARRRSRPGRRRGPMVDGDYELPPLPLLAEPKKQVSTVSKDALEQNATLLESTLEDFGVRGEIINVRPGPVVTLYELEPAPGTKSSRVIGLADDIARSMSAVSARVAVVPGRNAIGIELPNQKRETVYLRELIASQDFADTKQKLALCLGKNIGGEPIIADLARMPHLLVAGTTGSGKSVAINTMILSLLYRHTPEQCRLIMVDPKMLELSVYDGIPHLLSPVVTDPKKAVIALEMGRARDGGALQEDVEARRPQHRRVQRPRRRRRRSATRSSPAPSRPASTARPARRSTRTRSWISCPCPTSWSSSTRWPT